MITLSIDIGFANTGVAVINSVNGQVLTGVISTKPAPKKQNLYKSIDDVERCKHTAKQLWSLIEQHKPDLLVVELPTGGAKGARANRAMGIVTGLIAAISAYNDSLPVVWVRPEQVKKLVTGTRKASKEQIIAAMSERVEPDLIKKFGNKAEHVADAIAAAYVAMDSEIYKAMVKGESR